MGIYNLEEIHNIPATIVHQILKLRYQSITSLKWPLGVWDPS